MLSQITTDKRLFVTAYALLYDYMGEIVPPEPAEVLQPTGIYAAVYVEPIGRHSKFFNQFNSRTLRENLAAGNMHVSVQYPREVIDQGVQATDYEQVADAAALAQSRLGKMGLFGVEFYVDTERGIQGKKKWWTVEVDEEYDTLFNQCRQAAALAVEETLEGITIAHSNPDGYHVSLVHRGKSSHSRMKAKIAPPQRWRVTGVGVIQSTVSTREAAEQLAVHGSVAAPGSDGQSYANRPRRLQTNHAARK